jgi:hypothetical protein
MFSPYGTLPNPGDFVQQLDPPQPGDFVQRLEIKPLYSAVLITEKSVLFHFHKIKKKIPNVTVALRSVTVDITPSLAAKMDSAFKSGDHKEKLPELRNEQVLTQEENFKSIAPAGTSCNNK